MKINDETIDAMIRAGMITAFGGTGDEVTRVVTTVADCDEAQVVLRKNGRAVGVLTIADPGVDETAARERAFKLRDSLQ